MDDVLSFMLGIFFGFVLGIIVVATTTRSFIDVEKDAIENNVGTYYIDEEHNKKFRWLTQEEICNER